jgi:hypothetical protein
MLDAAETGLPRSSRSLSRTAQVLQKRARTSGVEAPRRAFRHQVALALGIDGRVELPADDDDADKRCRPLLTATAAPRR